LSPEEVKSMLAAPKNLQHRTILTTMYASGPRVSQVDLDARLIRLEEDQTKTGEARVIPLPAELVNMLQTVEPKVGRVFAGTNLHKEWTKACAAVGLGRIIEVSGRKYDPRYVGLIIYDLRRSAIHNLDTVAGVPGTGSNENQRAQDAHCFR
jgi:integrase